MLDSLKGLSGLADSLKPDRLDLGDYDKAADWLRSSAWACHSMGLSNVRLKDLLDSWLTFISDLDSINHIEMISLTAFASVIYSEISGSYFSFNIEAYFKGV